MPYKNWKKVKQRVARADPNPFDLPEDFFVEREKRRKEMIVGKNKWRVRDRRRRNGPYSTDLLVELVRLIKVEEERFFPRLPTTYAPGGSLYVLDKLKNIRNRDNERKLAHDEWNQEHDQTDDWRTPMSRFGRDNPARVLYEHLLQTNDPATFKLDEMLAAAEHCEQEVET